MGLHNTGFKRVIIFPFLILMVLGFLSFWVTYLVGSRDAIRTLLQNLAETTAVSTQRQLSSYLSNGANIALLNAAHFTNSNSVVQNDWITQKIFLNQLQDIPDLAIISVATMGGEYAEAQRRNDASLRIAYAGSASSRALEFYLISESGEMLFDESYPDYDPRLRPWYYETFHKESLHWSSVYALYSDSQLVISAAVPFFVEDATAGVTSVVMSLDRLSDFLTGQVDPEEGIIIIHDKAGGMIAASSSLDDVKDSAGQRIRLSEHSNPFIAELASFPDCYEPQLRAKDMPFLPFIFSGQRYAATRVCMTETDTPDWVIIVALRESAFTENLSKADQQTFFLLFVLLILFVLVGVIVVHIITKPIQMLQVAVTELNLEDPADSYELASLASQNNEFGKLAKSFVDMNGRIVESFQSMKHSLNEKEMLLKEVHHRVKNNLQIVSSMINLQTRSLQDKKSRDMLQQCQDRIQTMAFVHENAYTSGLITEIDMQAYLDRICSFLRFSHKGEESLTLTVSAQDIKLPLEIAIPCGLIVNELVTNSFKHADFPDSQALLRVLLVEIHGEYRLSVVDNGVKKEVQTKSSGIGQDLISALAVQLNGELSQDSTNGYSVKLVFSL